MRETPPAQPLPQLLALAWSAPGNGVSLTHPIVQPALTAARLAFCNRLRRQCAQNSCNAVTTNGRCRRVPKARCHWADWRDNEPEAISAYPARDGVASAQPLLVRASHPTHTSSPFSFRKRVKGFSSSRSIRSSGHSSASCAPAIARKNTSRRNPETAMSTSEFSRIVPLPQNPRGTPPAVRAP